MQIILEGSRALWIPFLRERLYRDQNLVLGHTIGLWSIELLRERDSNTLNFNQERERACQKIIERLCQ